MPDSSGDLTTGAGCASLRRSLRIFRTSEPKLNKVPGPLRSRSLRLLFAAVFVIAVVSPVAVVFAVVWTAPSIPHGSAPTPDTQTARLLPAPDVQPTALPDPTFNVYANTLSGTVPCPLCELPARVYVPNSRANTVDVIDPNTYKIIDHFAVGSIPHHIAPAWDMSALYVDNEGSSNLTVIDIHTCRPSGSVSIPFPYHLYFTPDGSYLMISTEYSGVVAKVDTINMKLVGYVRTGGLPIDVRLSPDGKYFYVTNQGSMGVSVIDPIAMQVVKFIPTGRGAHGLQVSRDTRSLYVSNRLEGSVSVIDFATQSVVNKWTIPGGGS